MSAWRALIWRCECVRVCAASPTQFQALVIAQHDTYVAQHEAYAAALSSRASEIEHLKLSVALTLVAHIPTYLADATRPKVQLAHARLRGILRSSYAN